MAKARSRPGCTFLSRPLHSRQVALSLFIRPRAGRHVELQQQARASLAAIRRHSPLRNVTLSPLLRLVTLSLLRLVTPLSPLPCNSLSSLQCNPLSLSAMKPSLSPPPCDGCSTSCAKLLLLLLSHGECGQFFRGNYTQAGVETRPHICIECPKVWCKISRHPPEN